MLELTMACGDYDRTRALKDGRVRVEGCDINFIPLGPEEVFFRAFHNAEFDICELSFSSYMLQTSRNECEYVAIPAFVSRVFRHSSIYVRTDRGIRSPADLKGKLVGLPEYQMTAMLWIRGMLKDEYGVQASDIHYRNGGQEEPGRQERVPLKLPKEIDLQPIPRDETLVRMFVAGKLDALFTAREPSCFLEGAPNIARLFPNYREDEKAYFKRTGLFPIMHLVGIRKTLAEKHPWLPTSVYKAFLQARAIAMADLPSLGALNISLPWSEAEKLDTIAVMGRDFWKYGVVENARDIEAVTRYSYEQGLATRKLTAADLFHRGTLEMSKV
jgi:4,5-dihydroxyphthalate decarboxylase